MHDDVVSAIIKATLEAADRARWQPIETAPKDGTLVLLTVDYDPVDLNAHPLALTEDSRATTVGHNNVDHDGDNVWRLDGVGLRTVTQKAKVPPTHWQPLPSPPVTK